MILQILRKYSLQVDIFGNNVIKSTMEQENKMLVTLSKFRTGVLSHILFEIIILAIFSYLSSIAHLHPVLFE